MHYFPYLVVVSHHSTKGKSRRFSDELLNHPAATVGIGCQTSDWPKLRPPLPTEEFVRYPNNLGPLSRKQVN